MSSAEAGGLSRQHRQQTGESKMRQVWLVMLAAFAMAAPLATAVAQESRTPVGFEDIKALYKEADLIVLFQAETVQANPSVAPRLVWEVKGPVIEVVKGKLLPGP